MKKFFVIFMVFAMVFSLAACTEKSELEKEGYVFNDEIGTYEKEGDKANEVLVNFTQNDTSLNNNYVVKNNIDHIVFEGEAYREYTDFSIKIASRSKSVYVELKNFSYKAAAGKVAFDASGVTAKQTVYIVVNGTCSIIGGAGLDGENGSGYSTTAGVNDPSSGEEGKVGKDGNAAILANTLQISIQSGGSLNVLGGQGGNGGLSVSIKDDGEISCKGETGEYIGGNGGNGGKGGNGGNSKKTTLYGAGNPGSAGNGGNGGDGASAFVNEVENVETLGGQGGTGGSKGNAGESNGSYGNGGHNGADGASRT